MSIKNVWTILTRSSSVDKDSNTLSLFEIIEEVGFNVVGPIPEKAALPLDAHLVSFWGREEAGEETKMRFKMVLRDPKNKALAEHEGVIKMEPQHKRYRFIAKIQGMPITESGVYRYDIVSLDLDKTDGKELLASVPIEVKILAQPIKSPIKI